MNLGQAKLKKGVLTKSLIFYLDKLDGEYSNYIRYIGMLRLIKAVFTKYDSGRGKSWEESLLEALDTLPERESKILKMRFGIWGSGGRTLEEVSREFGVTRERIRQIEARAIRKLRHPLGEKLLLQRSDDIKKRGGR